MEHDLNRTMDDDKGGVSQGTTSSGEVSEGWYYVNRDEIEESTDDSESVEILSEGHQSSSSFEDPEVDASTRSRPASSLSSELMARFEAEETSTDRNENILIYLSISFLIVAGISSLQTNHDPGVRPSEFSRTDDDFAKDSNYDVLWSEVRSLKENNHQIKAILSTLKEAILDLKVMTTLPELETRSLPKYSHFTHPDSQNQPFTKHDEEPKKVAMNAAHENDLIWQDTLAGVKKEMKTIRKKLSIQTSVYADRIETKIHNGLCESDFFLGNDACSCHYREIFYNSDPVARMPAATKSHSRLLSILDIVATNLNNGVIDLHDSVVSILEVSFQKIIELIELNIDNSYRRVHNEVLTSLPFEKTEDEQTEKREKTPKQPEMTSQGNSYVEPRPETKQEGPESEQKSDIKIEELDENASTKADETIKPEKIKRVKQRKTDKDKKNAPKQKSKPKQRFDENTRKYDPEAKRRFEEKKDKRRSENDSFFDKNFRWMKKGLKYVTRRGKKEKDAIVKAVNSIYKKHGPGIFNRINSYFPGFDSFWKTWGFDSNQHEKQKNAQRGKHRDKDGHDDWRDFRGRKFQRKEKRERDRRNKRHTESEFRDRSPDSDYRKCLSRNEDSNRTEEYGDDFVNRQQTSWFVKMGKHRADLRRREKNDGEDWFLRRAKARRGRTR